jgi:hypothetical protein
MITQISPGCNLAGFGSLKTSKKWTFCPFGSILDAEYTREALVLLLISLLTQLKHYV